eukprot:11748804-Karenia_brevis.AAC.1
MNAALMNRLIACAWVTWCSARQLHFMRNAIWGAVRFGGMVGRAYSVATGTTDGTGCSSGQWRVFWHLIASSA